MPRKRTRKRLRRRYRARATPLLEESTKRTISGIVQMCVGVLLFLALQDQAGVVGRSADSILTFFFGSWGLLFPLLLLGSGLLHTFGGGSLEIKRSIGLTLCLLSFLGIMHIQAPLEEIGLRRDELAGAIGFMASLPFLLFASRVVGMTVLAATFLIGLFLAFEPDLSAIFLAVKDLLTSTRAPKRPQTPVTEEEAAFEQEDSALTDDLVEEDSDAPELNIVRPSFAQSVVKAQAEKAIKQNVKRAGDFLEMKDTRFEEWTFPSLDLLESERSALTINDDELKKQAQLIEEKLNEFGIAVTVRDARPGPTVTQFTLQPAEGVKLSKIGALKDDLALALAAQSLRIEAPIPGKSLVGIEMPNADRTVVHLREILEGPSFTKAISSLSLPLGRDVSGEGMIASLDDMPHLLIAGATGSGKSVCMNVFLTALLYQNAPDELKFILIDPKRVELMPYNGIPHLLTPVITDAERALQALRWAVAEMGRRLHRFSEVGVRNIEEYNEKQTEDADKLPRIIVVVDELADLMMRQFRRDTETMIVRIAQMARATGMHLIIATQRPSVDVITGLIKANIPTRIAFRVVSSVDSRTIIDGIGAEDLLGKGDMLYMTATTPKPTRIQGIYVSTKEVERVMNAVKIAGGGKITEQIGMAEEIEGTDPTSPSGRSLSRRRPLWGTETRGGASGTEECDEHGNPIARQWTSSIDLDADDNGGDDLFFDAVRVVQHSGKASASLLQRQLKVGYARAARLLDIMEERELIGPPDGAKPRKVYMERTAA